MGSTKWYKENGAPGAEYKEIGRTANKIKIVQPIKSKSENTPAYSNTPNTMYAALKGSTGKLKQISVYGRGADGRGKKLDIDIGHEHTNKINGMHFKTRDMHVHEYDKNGVRATEARKPNKRERKLMRKALYGRR